MFCYKCGTVLPDDAVFCYKCGTKVNIMLDDNVPAGSIFSTSRQRVAVTLGSSLDDNESIRVYLEDLFILECLKEQFENKKQILKEQYTQVPDIFYRRYEITKSENWINSSCQYYLHFCYDGFSIFTMGQEKNGIYIPDLASSITDNLWFNISKEQYMEQFRGDIWRYRIFWPEKGANWGKAAVAKKSGAEVFEKYLAVFQNECVVGYQALDDKREQITERIKGIDSCMEELKNLFRELYELKILPGPFRNIYAVLYLLDYLQTSNETLSSAISHCDLERVKGSLKEEIEWKKRVFFQKALACARNKDAMRSRQEVLQKIIQEKQQSTDIEDVSRAEYYAMILRKDSEIHSWLERQKI